MYFFKSQKPVSFQKSPKTESKKTKNAMGCFFLKMGFSQP